MRIGLLNVGVVLERRSDEAPLSAAVREVEGWMLGYVVSESAMQPTRLAC